jgi:hypothetical protein
VLRIRRTGGNRLKRGHEGGTVRTIDVIGDRNSPLKDTFLRLLGPSPVTRNVNVYFNGEDNYLPVRVLPDVEDQLLVEAFDRPETDLGAWIDRLIEQNPVYGELGPLVRAALNPEDA